MNGYMQCSSYPVELLATVPGTHPLYSELDRAFHGVVFISEKVARLQERTTMEGLESW
jgi:hypothetical protein